MIFKHRKGTYSSKDKQGGREEGVTESHRTIKKEATTVLSNGEMLREVCSLKCPLAFKQGRHVKAGKFQIDVLSNNTSFSILHAMKKFVNGTIRSTNNNFKNILPL